MFQKYQGSKEKKVSREYSSNLLFLSISKRRVLLFEKYSIVKSYPILYIFCARVKLSLPPTSSFTQQLSLSSNLDCGEMYSPSTLLEASAYFQLFYTCWASKKKGNNGIFFLRVSKPLIFPLTRHSVLTLLADKLSAAGAWRRKEAFLHPPPPFFPLNSLGASLHYVAQILFQSEMTAFTHINSQTSVFIHVDRLIQY